MTEPIPVYLVEKGNDGLPLSLGILEAYARGFEDGRLRERLSFRPLPAPTPEQAAREEPGVWLFPGYVWSHPHNLAISRAVKQASPRSITVHGGPNVPSRPDACEAFLRAEPSVDVAVRGEGEITCAELLDRLTAGFHGGSDWREAGLETIEGLSFLDRPDGAMVRSPERPRIKDLQSVPSAYLAGTMKAWLSPSYRFATVETSRGCPYGCTFCDWGSATLQKVHKFDTERIKSEIEWIAAHQIYVLFISDANFGMFDRDVEIAEHVGRMRRAYGFPREAIVSYAKNGNERIPEIVRAMVSAGVVTEGVISIQTTDPRALDAVHRSNIKTSHYEKLVGDYRAQGLPVTTDLMVGLPGATLESHKRDIQWCIDEDLVPRFFLTAVLPNGPMADPAYQAEHGIQVRDGHVRATATASEEDLSRVWDLVRVHDLVEKATLLRYVMRYLQWEYGLPASDFLFSLTRALRTEPARFPAYLTNSADGLFDNKMSCMSRIMEDPEPFYEAVWSHARERLGVPLSSEADRVIFRLNAALIPRRGARYPIEVDSHWNVLDYFASCLAPKPGERRKLVRVDPPQSFEITDPQGLATRELDHALIHNNALRTFELHWPCLNPVMINPIY